LGSPPARKAAQLTSRIYKPPTISFPPPNPSITGSIANQTVAAFDVDTFDPTIMPVMFPESGGLTFEETREILNLLWATGQVAGMSIACYHPLLDLDGSAGARLVNLIVDVLSGRD